MDHKSEGLTEGAAAIIAIAVTIATDGVGTSFLASASIANIGAQTAVGLAINAGFSTIASRASVSLINNKGNISKVFKELGSSQFVKSLATSILTASLHLIVRKIPYVILARG